MSAVSISGTVREILKANPTYSADEVIAKAKSRGVTAPANGIRVVVHKVRSELRKVGVVAPAAKPATPVAKPATPVAKPGVAKSAPVPATKPAAPVAKASVASTNGASTDGLSHVFTNVTRVNTVIGLCGGIDHARQAAEAVRACGSVEAFLQHLDLVAGIRTPQKA
ncbi:hypothetical protein [Fimbriiglobus ruber]|uniref:Uncharacterized protein n=1 Tax=Fimbriiglobus ruber TaxID=1908690 RepID=A0A225E1A1_9BACT|nr:hypothetical protein [Fimbriiglobus ruber]OWK43796.1 hypothetical protein FRUB_03395 [Fimbriiglobus ruber]